MKLIMMNSGSGMSLPSWERGLKLNTSGNKNLEHMSLPSWERGLKWIIYYEKEADYYVAPFVGAWIEIGIEIGSGVVKWIVAPFVGAWIEIACKSLIEVFVIVAPFVGAWIEISIY